MNSSRNRKIAYLLTIPVLFSLLYLVSQHIERVAEENQLAQRSLGEVDPVSGTANLVCFGFRGIAVTFLWNEINYLKERQQWHAIRPVLRSITLLQPNFVTPWQFQAWNLAYNICAEWEAVPDKYDWIKTAVVYMKMACAKNKNNPDLQWYVGWLYYNRFGMSDEKLYLRQLFRKDKDTDYTENSLSGKIDSFLTAHDRFQEANASVLEFNIKPKRMGITPFMSHPGRALLSYAEYLAEDDVAAMSRAAIDLEYEKIRDKKPLSVESIRKAWQDGYVEWREFGLGYNSPRADWGREAFIHLLEYSGAQFKSLKEEDAYWSDRFGKIVRYTFWRDRAIAEQSTEMLEARRAILIATRLREESDYEGAAQWYEVAFPRWRAAMENFAVMREDALTQEDSREWERDYLNLLPPLGRKLPEKRPLHGVYGPEPETIPAPKDKVSPKPGAELPPGKTSSPTTKVPAKPEIKPEVKPEPKVDAKPEVKPEVKPEPKVDAKPEVKPEAKPEVKSKPTTKVESKSTEKPVTKPTTPMPPPAPAKSPAKS